MVTLALAQMAFTLGESNVGELTNGDNGLGVTGAPDWLTAPGTGAHFYYVALVVLVAGSCCSACLYIRRRGASGRPFVRTSSEP
jgi:ABC-type branched-subunit amino acid transport system permease subunit